MDTGGTSRCRSALSGPQEWCLLWLLLSLPAVAAEAPSGNPHLRAALQLFDALEYDGALRVLDKAEQWPSNTSQDRVAIALLEGVLAFETQQPVRGERAFQRALDLDRTATLPVRVSPKVAAQLEELRAKLPLEKSSANSPQILGPPLQSPPDPMLVPAKGMSLKLPVAIGGGAVAVGGLLAWGKAKSLEGKLRGADASITTQAKLEHTLQQGKALEKVGWILMGLGAAITAGSVLFLDAPAERKATITPIEQGAHLSVYWTLQ